VSAASSLWDPRNTDALRFWINVGSVVCWVVLTGCTAYTHRRHNMRAAVAHAQPLHTRLPLDKNSAKEKSAKQHVLATSSSEGAPSKSANEKEHKQNLHENKTAGLMQQACWISMIPKPARPIRCSSVPTASRRRRFRYLAGCCVVRADPKLRRAFPFVRSDFYGRFWAAPVYVPMLASAL